MTVEFGDPEVSYSARGIPSYRLEMWHHDLKKHRIIKGSDRSVVVRKAQLQSEDWLERAAQRQEKEEQKERVGLSEVEAEERTAQAAEALSALETLLADTLSVNDAIDWDQLKSTKPFGESRPVSLEKPIPPVAEGLPPEPSMHAFLPKLDILDRVLSRRRKSKIAKAAGYFEQAHAAWQQAVQELERATRKRIEAHEALVARTEREYGQEVCAWKTRQAHHYVEQKKANEAIDRKRALYQAADPDAVTDYCDMVLSNSQYPDWMPGEWDLEFNPENATLLVEYSLPTVEAMPTLSQVRYVHSRDEFAEKHISDSQVRRLYDSAIYQIALRTVHELYEADGIEALQAVVYNGRVTSLDKATGHRATACIISLHTSRSEFLAINLAAVDPKVCFKSLKGVGSSKLHSLTAVAPIAEMRREDSRFVSAREVANTVDDSTNLAAMDWEDFEHLIREIFEKEFSGSGGEVKVTQASRDGGVDAIAFDPDPIRGGKIVIQAKRYTNTVGVAAVRDLYGTVMNEGANRGILVTTSDYGPDAYSFAKDKPLTLLNGANLLHLLQRHGQRARIDIKEARRLRQ